MSKNDSHLEHPEYEQLITLEQVEAEVVIHRDFLVGKDITESRIKHEKKTYVSALNEQLKELNEEREHEIGVLSALDDRRRVILAQNQVLTIPKPLAKK